MSIFLSILIFAVSTFVLVKSADYFILAIDRIGRALNLPTFFTGVLFVALGTSLPELMTGIVSVTKGETDMLVGNVLGSDIANIFLGLGAVVFFARRNINFTSNILRGHFIVLLSAVAMVAFMMLDQVVTATESIFLLALFFIYLWFLFHDNKTNEELIHQDPSPFLWKDVGISILTLGLILGSSNFLVDSVIDMSLVAGSLFGVSEEILKTSFSATLVAVGTSLPEMIVVYAAIKQKQYEMAIGNIVGSNIFNIVLIMGVGGLIAPLAISTTTLTVILPFTGLALGVYWIISKTKEVTRYEGLAMTIVYLFFLGILYGWV